MKSYLDRKYTLTDIALETSGRGASPRLVGKVCEVYLKERFPDFADYVQDEVNKLLKLGGREGAWYLLELRLLEEELKDFESYMAK